MASGAESTGGATAFWGGARDIGLIVVAVLGFAGSVYTYTYTHELGIDFSLANTSAVSSLIAATKIFVDNAVGTLVCVGIVLVLAAIVRFARRKRDNSAIASFIENPYTQLLALGLAAVVICGLGYTTAEASVRRIRQGIAQNTALINLERGAESKYPAALLEANRNHALYIVFESTDRLYVLDQPLPFGGTIPNAEIFSIRKDDIVSVETFVPEMALPSPSPGSASPGHA